MATRQYIGSRYVPLFADPITWDNTQAYEALTVVLHQGNSYVSKQPVPAGADISNTTYWIRTADYNAQLEQYRQQVDTLSGSVGGVVSDMQDVTDAMVALEDRVNTSLDAYDDRFTDIDATIGASFDEQNSISDFAAQVSSDIAGVSDRIGPYFTSQNPVSAFRTQTLNTFGNDFSPAYSVSQFKTEIETAISDMGGGGGWRDANVLAVLDSWGNEDGTTYGVSKCWLHRACDILQANYIDLHEDGSGFINGTTTFEQRVRTWAANNDPESVNYIVVSGGVNDYASTEAQIKTAVVSFMNACATLYPNANIIMVPQIAGANIAKCYVTSSSYNQWIKAARAMQDAYAENNLTRAIIVTKMQYVLNMRTDTVMNSDAIHPTQLGHDIMGKCFVNALFGSDEIEFYYVTDIYFSVGPNGTKYPITNSGATIIKHPTFLEIGLVTYMTGYAYSDADTVPTIWIPNVLPTCEAANIGTCTLYDYTSRVTHIGYCSTTVSEKTYLANASAEPLFGIGLELSDRASMVGHSSFYSSSTLFVPLVEGFQTQ